VGYPGNQNFDYSPLIPFLNHSLNNVGDPFHRTNYRANTHEFEQEVIFHFAQLMGLDPEDAWGYVTSGGTEGNMYGLYLARELHPEGMLYFSEEAHYSILKIARILNMPHTTVKRRTDGEIDYDDLRDMLTVHRDRPAIIRQSFTPLSNSSTISATTTASPTKSARSSTTASPSTRTQETPSCSVTPNSATCRFQLHPLGTPSTPTPSKD
jgi:hypothetical protein